MKTPSTPPAGTARDMQLNQNLNDEWNVPANDSMGVCAFETHDAAVSMVV
jgi:hypothetical protein